MDEDIKRSNAALNQPEEKEELLNPAKETTPDSSNISSPTHQSAKEGGWAWVVVFSCFFQNLLVDGTLCSFGTLLVYLIDEFEATNLQTSCILSIQLSLQALFSPLASALIINFGGRVVMMVGAGLMAFGVLASGFVPNIYYLYLTLGVITGIGMSMLSQTAAVVISFYFTKRRGLAYGISTTGSGLGFFLFPPLTTYLLEELGLHGACLMLSGVMMQGIVCGALVIPAADDPLKRRKKKGKHRSHGIASLVKLTHTQSLMFTVADQSSMYLSSWQHYQQLTAETEDKSFCAKFIHILREITKASFDAKLLKNGAFMLYLVGTVLRQLVGYIPSMFIVSRALHFGIRNEETGFLMSIFGVTNIIGRLVFGIIADTPLVAPRRCYLYGFMSIAAGAVSLYNFGEQLSHQMAYCGLYGLMFGCTISMKCTVLADLIGNEKICTGFGMIMFAAGFTVFLGPTFAGWIFDKTASYDIVFGICGSVFIASGLVVLPSLFLLKRQSQPKHTAEEMIEK